MHRTFVSHKAAASQVPLGVFATVSLDRIGALIAQCRSWPGTLSAAVYVMLNETSPSADGRGVAAHQTRAASIGIEADTGAEVEAVDGNTDKGDGKRMDGDGTECIGGGRSGAGACTLHGSSSGGGVVLDAAGLRQLQAAESIVTAAFDM